jgi:hypothetical protein
MGASLELEHVSTHNLNAIAQLADETKFYWSLLHTAVRLSRNWHPDLEARSAEAERDALSLGRQLAGGARVATLADLRILSRELIEGALARMMDSLATASDNDPALEHIRQLVGDVAETGRLLFRGVDIHSCCYTGERSARRRLLKRLGRDQHREHLLDTADELVRQAYESQGALA